MSHYHKPKWIKITLRLMLIGIIIGFIAGAIVPYLPSATDDINTMTSGIATGVESTETPSINPNSILNQFQQPTVTVSGSGSGSN